MTNSWTATAWATEMSAGHPPLARFVLIVGLAVRVGDRNGNRVFPSIELISKDTGIGQTTVKKWLRYLEEHGLIVREKTRRSDGTRGVNSYYLPIGAAFHIKREKDQWSESVSGENHGRKLAKPRSDFDETTVGIRLAEQDSEEQDSENLKQSLHISPDESELPLGLPPIIPPEPTLAEISSFVETEWRAREVVRQMRGGKLTEANAEKARDLAKASAGEGQTAIDVWREIFERIDASDFLLGNSPASTGHSQFRLTILFLLEKRNFEKVLGGRYDGKKSISPKVGSTTSTVASIIASLPDDDEWGDGRSDQGGAYGRGQTVLSIGSR